MRNIILMLIAFLMVACNHSNVKENDLQKENLKGKVKSVRLITYSATQNNKKGEVSYLSENFLATYSENGYVINKIDYSFKSKTSYKYDRQNNKVEGMYYNNIDDVLTAKITYLYKEKEKKIEENWIDTQGELGRKDIYKYDENRNIIEYIQYDSKGNIKKKYSYQYDSKGNKVEEKEYKGDTFKTKIVYQYNEKGLCTKKEEYDNRGNNISEKIYEYNANKDKIKEKFNYFSLFSTSGKVSFDYEYDNQGNWIKLIQFLDGAPYEIIEREIKYY